MYLVKLDLDPKGAKNGLPQAQQWSNSGWHMLHERASGAHRKVRVFYERKDPQRYFVAKLSIVAIYTFLDALASLAFKLSQTE